MPTICSYQKSVTADGSEYDPDWLLPMPDEVQQWADIDDQTYVGVCDVLGDGGVELSASDLLARARSINARHPIYDPETGGSYTDEALEQAVADWIAKAGA